VTTDHFTNGLGQGTKFAKKAMAIGPMVEPSSLTLLKAMDWGALMW